MALQLMLVTGHGTFSPAVYTLLNAGGSGLVSVTVLCNVGAAPLWGVYFGVAATVGIPSASFTALWTAVTNAALSTTLSLEVNGSTVTDMTWSSV